MAPVKRTKDKHLPPRVYYKNGAYYFVDLKNKWHRLGKSLAEAMQNWAKTIERPLTSNYMRSVFDRYLSEISPKKALSTYKKEIYSIKNLKAYFGNMLPSDITPVDVYKFLDIRKQTSLVMANQEVSLLSSVLSTAIRWGLLMDNVCRNVKKYPEPRRDRYVEDWEFEAVYKMAPELIKAAMILAYLTGLRLGDIITIKLADLTESGIKIKTNKTKTGLLIEWTDALRDAVELAKRLKRHVRGLTLFCNKKGAPYSADGFKSIWQRVMNRAIKDGIIKERFRFHDLRRKAATDLEAKSGREFARKLLGHSTQKMTENYIAGIQKVKPVR